MSYVDRCIFSVHPIHEVPCGAQATWRLSYHDGQEGWIEQLCGDHVFSYLVALQHVGSCAYQEHWWKAHDPRSITDAKLELID